jgi:hypothetical protein
VVIIISNVLKRVRLTLSSHKKQIFPLSSSYSNLGLDHNQSFINNCSSSDCWIYFISVKKKHFSFLYLINLNKFSRRAKFEAELKAMQWLIKWEELAGRTLLHHIVATPSFHKLSLSQKVIFLIIKNKIKKFFLGFIRTEVSEF